MTGKNCDFQCTLLISCFENKPFLTVYFYHVMNTFQSESTLCSCLNVKELSAQSRHCIRSLSDCNRIQIHNHLVCKLVWLNGWVFIYKLSGCGFKSCCSNLNFLNIYQASKFQVFMETNGSFPYSFVVSNLHLETNGSWLSPTDSYM